MILLNRSWAQSPAGFSAFKASSAHGRVSFSIPKNAQVRNSSLEFVTRSYRIEACFGSIKVRNCRTRIVEMPRKLASVSR
jgi:hypothetical protein